MSKILTLFCSAARVGSERKCWERVKSLDFVVAKAQTDTPNVNKTSTFTMQALKSDFSQSHGWVGDSRTTYFVLQKKSHFAVLVGHAVL